MIVFASLESSDVLMLAAVLGALMFLVGLPLLVWAAWRIKKEDSWQRIAERRLARLGDAEAEREKVARELEQKEEKWELHFQEHSRTLARLDKYERLYGALPPDERLTSRG